jgi:PAS domain S-box-containing protein
MSTIPGEIRVLHVDDDDAFAELVATYLEREDDRIDVVTTTAVADAVAALDDDVDCVLADYDMPDRTGIEFLEVVQERYPDLPFVLFTGKGSEEIASEAISAGVTDYLQKGTGTEQYTLLANRIVNAVESYRSRRVLEERKRRLETLIDNLPGFVYRCENDPGWPMEYVEGDCEQLTGYTAAELESDDSLWGEEVLHPDDRDRAWDVVQSALSDDGQFELTYRIVTRAGNIEWMWERGQAIYEGDELVALEGFVTSITDQKEHQRELERKNRRLDEFATIVSHDLRNPLAVANGHTELAREECDSDHLDPVADAHDRMRRLIEGLLDLARDGETTVEPVALASAAEYCRQNVGGVGELVVETDRVVRADRSRLRQLFENLFRNSVEHGARRASGRSAPGDSVEHCSTGNRTSSGDSVEHGSMSSRPEADDTADDFDPPTVTVGDVDGGFFVADDGRGIDADAGDVFTPGYSTNRGGTGLGLAIVRRVAEDHGWEVTLTDGEGGGARFEFTGVEFADGDGDGD